MNKKEHLPLLGVGPAIVAGQIIITVIGIVISIYGYAGCIRIAVLDVPLKLIGVGLIVFGAYLNYSAKQKSKLFEKVSENRLITTGVYSIVRNPVYSAVLLICTGIVFIVNNVLLFVIPIICWIYMTIFVMTTEEKWLKKLYGKDYIDYCKKVNRCIPWFPKK